MKVARELEPGQEFSYVFDLSDDRRHRCRVEREKADALDEYGVVPPGPTAIWG